MPQDRQITGMTTLAPDTRPMAAALTMLAAMAVIGVIDNAISVIARDIGIWQFMAWRALLAIPVIWLGSRLGLGRLAPRRLWAVALRGALVALAMLFYFGSLAIMPIAQALGGLFTSPIFILLVTAFALRQPVGPWRIFAVTLGFVGILVVLQPDPERLSWVTFLPVFGGFFYALGAIATRTLCAGESVMSMLLALIVIQGVIGLVAMAVLAVVSPEAAPGGAGFVLRGWVWPMTPLTHLLMVVQAVGSVIGVGLIIRAYQLGDPSHVSVFEYSVFIFGPLAAYLMLGQPLGWSTALGIMLIAIAGIVIVLRARGG